MRIMVLAPHPDDEAIGCGGALGLHADAGDRAVVVFLTSGERGLPPMPREEAWAIREAEARLSCAILGAAEPRFLRLPDGRLSECVSEAAALLAPLLAEARPERLYLPHPDDNHPDHRACLPAARAALAASAAPLPALWGYEVWTPLARFDHALDVTAAMRRKLAAVRAHASQLGQMRYDRAARGLGLYRGAMAGGCRYAEAFREMMME